MIRNAQSILVVIPQRIGDVVLSTPVFASLRVAAPQAHLAALVFAGTEGVFTSNTDIDEVISVPRNAPPAFEWELLKKNFRRFDIAASLIAGDRPTLYAALFSKYSVGVALTKRKYWMQRVLLDKWVPYDAVSNHTVIAHFKVLRLLNIEPIGDIAVTWNHEDEMAVRRAMADAGGTSPYAVIHPCAKFPYKAWTLDGWSELCAWLRSREVHVYVSGGADASDTEFISRLLARANSNGITSLAGKLSLPQVSYLLSEASLFIGPDTGITHIAAGMGVRTITLFGPSSPVRWGPWPKGIPWSRPSPWEMRGSQQLNNVILLQGRGHCVPCLEEGCERHVNSLSECLQRLQADEVIAAAEKLLLTQPADPVPMERTEP